MHTRVSLSAPQLNQHHASSNKIHISYSCHANFFNPQNKITENEFRRPTRQHGLQDIRKCHK